MLQVKAQITEMGDNIDRLQNAVSDKEAPLKLAHTRLDNRSNRPNVELCRDPVQYRLVEEVATIEGSVEQLQVRIFFLWLFSKNNDVVIFFYEDVFYGGDIVNT